MFDKEIGNKKELLEVIEALDKLDKNYVITKSKRKIPEMHYEMGVWHVKELIDNQSVFTVPLNIDNKGFAEALKKALDFENKQRGKL